MMEDFDYSMLGILPGEDQDQMANGGYAPAVPPSPDTSDLGVSSLAPPASADLGAPAVSTPPPSPTTSSGRFEDFLRMRAPDLGPSGSSGGGGAVGAPKAPAPIPGPFGPWGPRGNVGPFGFRGR